MKEIDFDEHQAALELGYSAQQLRDFAAVSERLQSWRKDIENGKASPVQMPAIDKKLLDSYGLYNSQLMDKKLEFVRKNKHLFL